MLLTGSLQPLERCILLATPRRAPRKALAELTQRFDSGAPYQIAAVYAWRGERKPACEWLETAFVQHAAALTLLKNDPMLARLRARPALRRNPAQDEPARVRPASAEALSSSG